MLAAICFDLMDTVLRDPYLDALEASTGLDVALALARKDPDCWPDFELAKIDEAEFARRFFTDGTGELDLEAFHRVRRAGYRFVPGMDVLLDHLAGRVRRYVASNYPVWIEELRTEFALDDRFEGIWASCHLGVRKPDAEFFHRLLAETGHDPGQCLFVDDRADNCQAAERVGMRAHQFTGAADLAQRLRAEGIAVPG